MVLHQGWFWAPGDTCQCREALLAGVTGGRGEATEHPVMHRTAPPPKPVIILSKMSTGLRCRNAAHIHCHMKPRLWIWKSTLFFSLFPTTELSGRRNKPAVMGLRDWGVLPLARNPVTSRPHSPIGVTVISFFSIKTPFPCWHSYFVHKPGSEMQWGLTPWTQRRGRGIPRRIWNSFGFQKHENNHSRVCALCNTKLLRNCFVLGRNSHMIHHEMKSGKSFWINGPINSIEFPWQHRLQHSTTNKRL